MLIQWGETCPSLGSEQCPCVVADFKACPACSHLAGLPLCDCNWKGHCPYLEKNWSSNSVTVAVGSEPKVLAANQTAPKVLELVVALGERSLYAFAEPGSVVRIGSANVPVETTALVMDSVPNKRLVLLAISLDDPRNSLLAQNNVLWVDRQVGNMLLGRETLARQAQSNILLMAQGIWQAGLLLVAQDLIQRGCQIQAITTPDDAGANFAAKRLQAMGAVVQEVPFLTEGMVKELVMKQPVDVIVGLGDEHLQRWMGSCFATEKQPLVVTNDLLHYPI